MKDTSGIRTSPGASRIIPSSPRTIPRLFRTTNSLSSRIKDGRQDRIHKRPRFSPLGAVDQLTKPVLVLVEIDHVLLGGRAGRGIPDDAVQRNRPKPLDEIDGRPAVGGDWVAELIGSVPTR